MEKKVLDLTLSFTEGSFEEVLNFQKAVADALRDKGIKVSLDGLNFEDAAQSDINDTNASSAFDKMLSVITDKNVRRTLLEMAARCTVEKPGGEKFKVNPNFFRPLEHRKYYFPVMGMIGWENLAPFGEGLVSESSDLVGLAHKFLKVKDPS